MRRLIQIVFLVIVASVIVYAFVLIGSPAYNRLLLEDEATVQNVEHLQCAIHTYYANKGKLPETLATLEGYKTDASVTTTGCGICNHGPLNEDYKDAVTGQNYEYTPAGSSYTLCAHFHADWDALKQNRNSYSYMFYTEDLHYKAGRFCFQHTLENCKKH